MIPQEGKCSDCKKDKPLDAMIRDDTGRGSYHCVDCEVEHNNEYYDNPFNDIEISEEVETRTRKLLGWCFG